jgi:periplasmic protein TonB
MSHLKKKCYVISLSGHVVLLLVLIVGPAFFVPKEKPIQSPAMQMVSSALIEKALAQNQVKEVVTQPPKKVEEPKPIIKKEEPKPEPQKPKEPKPKIKKVDPLPKPPEKKKTPIKRPKIDISKLKTSPRVSAQERQEAERRRQAAAEAARQKRAALLNSALNKLDRHVASSSTASIPTLGNALVSDYASKIRERYLLAWNGIKSTVQIQRRDLEVTAKVVIRRNGSVASATISKATSDAAANSAIERLLNSVRSFPPLPKEIKGASHTFSVKFPLI